LQHAAVNRESPCCLIEEIEKKIMNPPGKLAKKSVLIPTQAELDLYGKGKQ